MAIKVVERRFTMRRCHVYRSAKPCKYQDGIIAGVCPVNIVMFKNGLDVPGNGLLNHEISYLFGQSTRSYATYITNNTQYTWIATACKPQEFYLAARGCARSKAIMYLTPKRIESNTVFALPDSFRIYLINAA